MTEAVHSRLDRQQRLLKEADLTSSSLLGSTAIEYNNKLVSLQFEAESLEDNTVLLSDTNERPDRASIAAETEDVSESRKFALEYNRLLLAAYAKKYGNDFKIFNRNYPWLFDDWKENAEKRTGEKLSWLEWLSCEHTTDDQLLNFLEWNEWAFHKINSDPQIKEAIERDEMIFQAGIGILYKSGYLSESMLTKAQSTTPDVVVGDNLNFALIHATAYYLKLNNVIKLRSPSADDYNHERLHSIGGIKSRLLEEVMATSFERLIDIAYATLEKREGVSDSSIPLPEYPYAEELTLFSKLLRPDLKHWPKELYQRLSYIYTVDESDETKMAMLTELLDERIDLQRLNVILDRYDNNNHNLLTPPLERRKLNLKRSNELADSFLA